MKHKVSLLSTDDWVGLYFDGELQVENHSLSSWDWEMIMAKLGVDFEWEYVELEQFEEWGGRCPDSWEDVV